MDRPCKLSLSYTCKCLTRVRHIDTYITFYLLITMMDDYFCFGTMAVEANNDLATIPGWECSMLEASLSSWVSRRADVVTTAICCIAAVTVGRGVLASALLHRCCHGR